MGERFARKLVGPSDAAKAAITKSSSLEKRPSDLERRHDKTRDWLINFLSLVLALLAGLYFKPEGAIAAIALFGGVYAAANLLHRWLMKD